MTDDLPTRLRHAFLDGTTNARLCHEAADRIDELESALRVIKETATWRTNEPWGHVYNITRRALGRQR